VIFAIQLNIAQKSIFQMRIFTNDGNGLYSVLNQTIVLIGMINLCMNMIYVMVFLLHAEKSSKISMVVIWKQMVIVVGVREMIIQ
jgi:hypothetical protein